jgi:hypothetical protein
VIKRRADRQLRLELLRARAAADRVELSAALQDVSDRFHFVRRAADSVESVARALSGRSHLVGWLATAGAALARGKWVRRALGGAAAGLLARSAPWARPLALGVMAAIFLGLRVRRRRRSDAKRASGNNPESAA